MLIYEKKENNERHLYGSESGIPASTDTQMTYTDTDGNEVSVSLSDSFVDAGHHGIKRVSDDKEIWAFVDDVNIIPGGKTKPTPPTPASGYKHTMRMYANNGESDSEFNVIVENDDQTEFTLATFETWLNTNGYTTADDKYYDNIVNVAGPEIDGVASKTDGVVVVNFKGTGAGANVDTFMGDTVTPANK